MQTIRTSELDKSVIRQMRTRLLFITGLLSLLVLLRFLMSTYTEANQEQLYNQQLVIRDDSSNVARALTNQETALSSYFTSGDQLFLKTFTSNRPLYLRSLDQLQMAASENHFNELLKQLSSVRRAGDNWYYLYALPQLANMQHGHQREAQASTLQGIQLFNRFRTVMRAAQNVANDDIQRQRNLLNAVNTVFLILSLLLFLAVTIAILRIFTRFVHSLQAQFTEHNSMLEQANIALRSQRDELRVLNNALEEANRLRNQFLTTMTHELRTPLTAIIGFSQIVLRDLDQSEGRLKMNVERISKNGYHLLHIVNDALDIVKIEAGQMELTWRPVCLASLFASLLDEFRPQAGQLTLKSYLAEDLSTYETDEEKLRQILQNLLSNALKFTNSGEIMLSATRLCLADTEEEKLAITVRDTGVGIAPEQQTHIFDAFYQADNTITRAYGGTGLGLSIVRQLVTLLGGSVCVESTPQHGSSFMLLLPLRNSNTPSLAIPQAEHSSKRYAFQSTELRV